MKKIKKLGYVIRLRKLGLSKEVITVVRDLNDPATQTVLRSFSHLFEVLSGIISNFSRMTAQLSKRQREDQPSCSPSLLRLKRMQ